MANGSFGGGGGTLYDPVWVEDAADLNAIRTKGTGLHYKLKNNINLDVAPYNTGAGWTPIPSFLGVLDGNGFVIKGLKINNPALAKAGLFADLSGNVSDLGFVNVDITAFEKAGALAGRIAADSVTVSRCYSTGKVAGENLIGGLVGEVSQKSLVKFSDCHSSVELNIVEDFAGGIVGLISSPFTTNTNGISYCYFEGTIVGGNLLTAGPLYGKAENLTLLSNVYDQDKIVQICNAAGCKAVGAASMRKAATFDEWRYRYCNENPIWKFLDDNSPRLWYEDVALTFLHFNNGYYKFNTATAAWVLVGDTMPTFATFLAQGMKPGIVIPIAKFKELEQYGTIEIVSAVESLAQGANTKRKIELLFDVTRQSKKLDIQTIVENALDSIALDRAPVKRALTVLQEDKQSKDAMAIDLISETEAAVDPAALISLNNHVKAKDLYVRVDDKQENTEISKGVKITNIAEKTGVSDFVGFTKTARQALVASTKGKAVVGMNANVVSETEAAVDIEALSPLDNHVKKKDFFVRTDDKKERADVSGSLQYEIYRTATKRDRAMHVDAKGETKSRYMISVNNGGKWLTYDSTTKEWVDAELRNISKSGITITQMSDETMWSKLPTDYRSKVKYAVGIRSESFNSTHKISGVDIEFMPNQGPLVKDAAVTVQSERIVVSGSLFDAENDTVEYQIVTKQFNETEWRQITPEQPGWFKRKNGYAFYHEYELSNFRAGDNTIKVVTRDSRGVSYEEEFQVILVTGEPTITINSQNEFYMNATLGHTLGKKVRFRILVNNQQMSPRQGFTEWKESPFTFDFSWDSKDLLQGLPNEITIETVDELNTVCETRFHVIGGYRSLLFKDENNFYYSTDKGEILQQLDFGTVIGGLLTEPRVAFLENRTGLTIENITIWADNATQEENVKLKLSETLDPFVPVESITFANAMANGESKAFYARVESDVDAASIQRKVFKVYAKGDPVVV